MKKVLFIVVSIVAVAALAFGVVNFVRAEKGLANTTTRGWFAGTPGMMDGRNGFDARGMQGRQNNRFDSSRGMMGVNRNGLVGAGIQQYVQEALAEKLGMTTDQLTKAFSDGKTILDLAADKGMTVKDYQTFIQETHVLAIDKALAAGVISQNQADAMKQNAADGSIGGFGPGWRR